MRITMQRKLHGQMSESFLIAGILSISGGLQDAYTYMYRGKVFANAQTGNIVLLAQNLIRSEERRVGKECRSRWSPYH